MKVLLGRQKAKFSKNKLEKSKKLKVRGRLEQEFKQREEKCEKNARLWGKRMEFMQGIEHRIETASMMTAQYNNLYRSLTRNRILDLESESEHGEEEYELNKGSSVSVHKNSGRRKVKQKRRVVRKKEVKFRRRGNLSCSNRHYKSEQINSR